MGKPLAARTGAPAVESDPGAGGAAPGRAREKRGCTPRECSPAVRWRGRAAPGARRRATARRPGGLERRGLAAAGGHRAGPGRLSPMARPLLPGATGVNAVYGPQVEAAMLTTPVPPGSEMWMTIHRAGIRVGRDDVRGRRDPGPPGAFDVERLRAGGRRERRRGGNQAVPAGAAGTESPSDGVSHGCPFKCRVRGRTDLGHGALC